MRVCRDCGCTEFNACVVDRDDTTYACFWLTADLCSFCALDISDDERESERPSFRGVQSVAPAGGVL